MPNNSVEVGRCGRMSWKKGITDRIADVLRFAAYVFLAFDAVVLSIFLFWFIVKFVWHFAQFIDYHVFQRSWY